MLVGLPGRSLVAEQTDAVGPNIRQPPTYQNGWRYCHPLCAAFLDLTPRYFSGDFVGDLGDTLGLGVNHLAPAALYKSSPSAGFQRLGAKFRLDRQIRTYIYPGAK